MACDSFLLIHIAHLPEKNVWYMRTFMIFWELLRYCFIYSYDFNWCNIFFKVLLQTMKIWILKQNGKIFPTLHMYSCVYLCIYISLKRKRHTRGKQYICWILKKIHSKRQLYSFESSSLRVMTVFFGFELAQSKGDEGHSRVYFVKRRWKDRMV